MGDTRLPLGDIAEGRPTDGGGGGDYIDEPLEAGMLVTARYQGGAQWYDGRILRKCEAEGFYDVRYDDGSTEAGVPLDAVSAAGAGGGAGDGVVWVDATP